jgi:hypothetical protein
MKWESTAIPRCSTSVLGFGFLAHELHDKSQAKKKRTLLIDEQIHTMTAIFTQNDDFF